MLSLRHAKTGRESGGVSYLKSSAKDGEKATDEHCANAAYVIGYGATHQGTDGRAEVVDGYNTTLVGRLCDDLAAVGLDIADLHNILGGVSIVASMGLATWGTQTR